VVQVTRRSFLFRSVDCAATGAQRSESIWFAPEAGRWVVRESTGIYWLAESAAETPCNESGYRWELPAWT